MKIGFVGAASTGKTSVGPLVAQQLELSFVPSIVRVVMASKNATEQVEATWTSLQRFRLQQEIMEAKRIQDRDNPSGVFDRTPIDHAAYMLIKCYEIMTEQELFFMLANMKKELNKYHALFYFPIYDAIPYADDGFRRTGHAYRFLQDRIMLSLLTSCGGIANLVPMCTVEERVDFIVSHCQDIARVKGLQVT